MKYPKSPTLSLRCKVIAYSENTRSNIYKKSVMMCSFASSLSSPPVFGNPFFLMTDWRESHRTFILESLFPSAQIESETKDKIG